MDPRLEAMDPRGVGLVVTLDSGQKKSAHYGS